MTRAEAKDYILHHPEGYLKPAKKRGTYICPLCGNGSGSTGDGLAQDKKDGTGTHWKCFRAGCDFYGDMIELIAKVEGIQDGGSREAFEAAYRAYGLTVEPDHQQEPRKQEQQQSRPAAAPKDYTEQYKAWHNSLLQAENALAYLESRGITRETADRFMLGYVVDQYNTPRIVIPRSRHDYTARRIDGGTEYRYMVTGRQGVLFNAKEAMKDKGDKAPVVVVEGEVDAMSIYQGGYTAVVALGTATEYKALVERARATYPAAVYILALDNDKSGRDAQDKAKAAMEAAGLHCIAADPAKLYGESKDAAEAIQRDERRFWEAFAEYIHQGAEQRQQREQAADLEAYYRTGAGMVDFFLQAVQGEKFRPISTGVSCIDRALNGGFFRQTLVTVGGAPAMGKTAIVAQICENLAQSGIDVIYFNLEMSRQQMLARSLARIANNVLHHHISVNEIMRGYEWTEDTRQFVTDAAAEYKEYIADRLIYNPGQQQTADLDAIMQAAEQEKARIGHAPVIVIDYLQLLSSHTDGRADDSVTTIKKAVQALKNYAIKNDTFAIAITANNRASMKTGESSLYSGRDTSALEFSADQQIGLEYRAINDRDDKKTLEEITDIKRDYFKDKSDKFKEAQYRKYACEIALRVNKNRWGEDSTTALLYFDGAASTFTPLDTYHQEPPSRAQAYRYNTSSSGPEWEDMELLP